MDDEDLEFVTKYYTAVLKEEEKQKARKEYKTIMQSKINERQKLLTEAFDVVNFRNHPALINYFTKKQVRLSKLLLKL